MKDWKELSTALYRYQYIRVPTEAPEPQKDAEQWNMW